MHILMLFIPGLVGGEDRDWHIRFGKAFNDWEIEEVASFFFFISSKLRVLLEWMWTKCGGT